MTHSAQPSLAGAAAPAGAVLRPEFTGSAREYFRIWIVNLFFSLASLGVYSAWAKVRKKKYFYGSTVLDGDSFEYLASPLGILKGRLIAFTAFVVYGLVTQLYPVSLLAFGIALFLLLPWIVVRTLTFNARNSAWRGVRFDFLAGPGRAARVYMGLLAVAVVTLGLGFPWFAARQKEFPAANHAFGTSRFGCRLPVGRFYGVYIAAALMILGFAALGGLFAALVVPRLALGALSVRAAFLAPVLAVYLSYAVAYGYVQARTTNLLWNHVHAPGVRFASDLRALELIGIYVTNILGIALSAGLLIPWAAVRTLRYRLAHFSMIVDEPIVHEANAALARVSATGEELGEFFSLDFGL